MMHRWSWCTCCWWKFAPRLAICVWPKLSILSWMLHHGCRSTQHGRIRLSIVFWIRTCRLCSLWWLWPLGWVIGPSWRIPLPMLGPLMSSSMVLSSQIRWSWGSPSRRSARIWASPTWSPKLIGLCLLCCVGQEDPVPSARRPEILRSTSQEMDSKTGSLHALLVVPVSLLCRLPLALLSLQDLLASGWAMSPGHTADT